MSGLTPADMDNDTKKEFEEAASKVASGNIGAVSQDEQLQLYGLYSVVRKGIAPNDGPSAWLDPTGFAKWTAWSTYSHLSTQEAMEQYIELVSQFLSREPGEQTQNQSHGFGSKGSTGFDISLEENGKMEEMPHDICYWATIGDTKMVIKCLKSGQYSVNYRDQDGLTPLMRAVDRNEEQIVDILVEAGAEINAIDNEGQTALHYAVYCEHSQMAAILVSYGASCDIRDSDGMSPFDVAVGETKEYIQQAQNGTWVRHTESTISRRSISQILQAISTSHGQLFLAFSAAAIVCVITRYKWKR